MEQDPSFVQSSIPDWTPPNLFDDPDAQESDKPTVADNLGTPVEDIDLGIDYTIIEHFSKHLYSSPNKAIEELVVNGYDAAATDVHVYLNDGNYTTNVIAIWDNGNSMSEAELHTLWAISNSPKKNGNQTVTPPAGQVRHVIGKFGIGKIASYTLGNVITHVCRKGENYLVVKVDYGKLLDDKAPAGTQSVSIYRLSTEEVDLLLDRTFRSKPTAFDEMRRADHWTLALIEKLKPTRITPGRLMWILGNAMPLRPDFRVWVGSAEVTPGLKKSGIAKEVDFGDRDLQTSLREKWKKAGHAEDTLEFGHQRGLDKTQPNVAVPYVRLPNLGIVWGVIRLYVNSLLQSEDSMDEEGRKRSFGFFIMVLDRLINDRDAKLYLPEPSFATFYRAQYVLHADGLNEDLLANREQLQRDTPRSDELAFLQQAVYGETVTWRDALLREDNANSALELRLPKESRTLFIEPITALLRSRVAADQVPSQQFLQDPKVERREMGEGEKLADLSENQSSLVVNVSHPYFKNLVALAGTNKRSPSVIREIELLAISETLFEGFLLDIGLDEHLVAEILDWRDKQYRVFASLNKDTYHVLLTNFKNAVFHRNLVDFKSSFIKLFKSVGFTISLVKSENKDWLKLRTFGSDSYTVAFEVQLKDASKGVTPQSVVAAAAKHVSDLEATYAVVVVGDITGFTDDDTPALLEACQAHSGVTIMNADAMLELAGAVHKFYYDHASLKPFFSVVETPRAKSERVGMLRMPAKDFDYNQLITNIIEMQKSFPSGAFPFMNVYINYYKTPKKDPVTGKVIALDEKTFINKLRALSTFSEPHITFDFKSMNVALGQAPERVRDAIAANLSEPEGDAFN